MAEHILLHKPLENFEQTDKMEAFTCHDVGGVQGSAHTKANPQSSACIDAAVCVEVAENANQVFGQAVAKNQYEDHQCNLRKSSAPSERRLGIRQR